jgi:hypothetical protein
MPLHFDVSKVENHAVVTTDPHDETQWHPLTSFLVDMTMSTGLNEITEANAQDFYIRVRALEAINGSYRQRIVEIDGKRKAQPIRTSWLEVKSHIGLHTNASSLTITAFWKRLRERHERDAAYHVEFAETEEAEKAAAA